MSVESIQKSIQKPKNVLYVALLGLLLLPLFVNDGYFIHILIMTFIWGVVVTNWNLTLGYAGMFHIAQFTLFAVGGYASAMSSVSFGLSPWVGLIIGGIAAAIGSLLIGMPALRVKGIYLILLTFAFHFGIKELVIIFREYTGGSMGIIAPSYGLEANSYYYFALLLLVLAISVNLLVEKSYIGKALVAVRDSEVLATSSGINPSKYKMITFTGAAFITGMAGAFYTGYMMVIGPEIFSFTLIVNGLGMIVIGGMGTLFGPVLGSFIITLSMEVFSSLEEYRPVIVGSLIILMLIYAPNGIINEVKTRLGKIL